MSEHTAIEWTDATWNPVTGCSVVSPGCTNCYAQQLAGTRLRNHPTRVGLTRESAGRHVWNGQVRFNALQLEDPIRWRRPRRIFVCAHGDLFHESVPYEWIDRVWGVMSLAPRHTFQVLTKRADRMREIVPQLAARHRPPDGSRWPLPNVWLGVSVEDQRRADERIPLLLQTPAAVRWLSCEPLLGPIDLQRPRPGPDLSGVCQPWLIQSGIDWVVAGGESGSRARPMHPGWARSLRDQCAAAGVPFFFKQWGEYGPFANQDHYTYGGEEKSAHAHAWVDRATADEGLCWVIDDFGTWSNWTGSPPMVGDDLAETVAVMGRTGKKRSGRILDGVEHNAYPVPQ